MMPATPSLAKPSVDEREYANALHRIRFFTFWKWSVCILIRPIDRDRQVNPGAGSPRWGIRGAGNPDGIWRASHDRDSRAASRHPVASPRPPSCRASTYSPLSQGAVHVFRGQGQAPVEW